MCMRVGIEASVAEERSINKTTGSIPISSRACSVAAGFYKASIMASATPFCFCTTQKHLSVKTVIISMA
jgi:hypothetical protein